MKFWNICKTRFGRVIKTNINYSMEKLLKLLSDKQLVEDILQAVNSFERRVGLNPDVKELKRKVINVNKLLKPIDYGKDNNI